MHAHEALKKPIEELRDETAAARSAAAAAAEDNAKAQREVDVLKSMQFVVEGLPPSFQTATKNADGKFRFEGMPAGSYLLAAKSSRETGDATERYAWCIPVEVKQGGSVSVMLSNHNLLVAK